MTQVAPDKVDGTPAEPEQTGEDRPSGPAPARWRRWLRSPDLRAVLIYLLTAGAVTERVWFYLNTYIMAGNQQDQGFFEWTLANAARVVTGLHNPFFTDQLNVPDGVNLMANTSAYGLTIPLVPVTLLFGPQVSFAVMITAGLAATATAWYWFFSRYLVRSRLAAFVGGAFCGFAPGMISQANAHPNIVAQFVLPLILAALLRLREPGRSVRNGIILGLLVVYQAFLNEELLFFLALASCLAIVVWAVHRRPAAKAAAGTFLRGLGVAALVAAVLLAYPLYVQFLGPQTYHGISSTARLFGADVYSYFSFSGTSLAGDPQAATQVSQNSAEQNSFFGWPLLVFAVLVVVLMWRRIEVRAAAIVGVVFAALSLGPILLVRQKQHTHIPTPYKALAKLPVFDSVITTRLSLVVIPVVGLLLALWLEQALAFTGPAGEMRRTRLVAFAAVLAVLLPVAPTRLAVVSRTPTPDFITSGDWKHYVTPGHSLVAVPVPAHNGAMDGMQWASTQGIGFALPAGYFLGPDRRKPDRPGMFGPPPRPTANILSKVAKTGQVPAVSEKDHANAIADLKFWRAAVVVLGPRKNDDALRTTTTALLGFPPTWIEGAWIWDVRALTS
ncbi:MAG: hypothetical protein E6F99_20850 [Actinobacteria bacterium]|nr:MAG: hypothetical protein E6F99_20850 [Actinomycetota bacterium]